MSAPMRVRQSPFGNPGAPPPSGGGGGGGGFGAPHAPGPSPPGSMGVAAPAPDNLSFDWMDQDFGSPAPAPAHNNSVSHPSPQFHQQSQQSQQFYQQPPQPQQPQQQQHQPFSQQQPFPGAGQSPSPTPFSMQGQVGMNGSNLLASGMGAMGMNSMMAGMMANGLANEFEGRAGQAIGWFPALFFGLQQLFRVGHVFVLRKMLLLLCPFVKRADAAAGSSLGGWGDESQQQQSSSVDADGLKTDIEEADLYIPSMACMTYVLLYGVQRAMLQDFSPEVLSTTFSFALVLFILEVGVFYMAFYFAGSPMAPLQIVANAGYKYFHVLLMVLLRMAAGSSFIYYIFFAYLAACSGWSVRRFMLKIEPSQLRQQYGVPASSLTRHIIDAMGIAQVPICWLLTPSAS